MTLNIDGVTLEENLERLKIVIPIRYKWPFLLVYSVLLVVWAGMLIYGLIFTIQIAFSGERFAFWFTFFLLLLLFILYRLGRSIWRQWQFYVANREILFLFEDHMVVRRPVSLLGITTAYDREYIRPFYYDKDQHSAAFEYGNRYVLLGSGLPEVDAHRLVSFLNDRYFPDFDEDE